MGFPYFFNVDKKPEEKREKKKNLQVYLNYTKQNAEASRFLV